jgi:hypothetical protein
MAGFQVLGILDLPGGQGRWIFVLILALQCFKFPHSAQFSCFDYNVEYTCAL